MKKPLKKKNIRSVHRAIKALFDNSTQYPAETLEDNKANPLETRIDQFIASIDQIKQAQADGYWSVLREL